MYSNKIPNFQESTIILNACTKKSGNLSYAPRMFKEDLTFDNLQWVICHKTQPNYILYIEYMCKEDLALNNLQWLICHKTKPKLNVFLVAFVALRPSLKAKNILGSPCGVVAKVLECKNVVSEFDLHFLRCSHFRNLICTA